MPPSKSPDPTDIIERPTFRPYTVAEHRSASREALLYAKAAREGRAIKYAMLLWPTAETEAVVPSGAPLAHLAEPEPHAEPVDGAALLEEFAATLNRYLVISEHAAAALALWALHTWAAPALAVSPRLALISPEPQAGKTTALRALSLLVPRPLFPIHGRREALTEFVEMVRPTLLLDDADKSLLRNRRLRAMILAGAARDTKLLRLTHTPFELPVISCFAPCALALSWHVPDDLAKSCIAAAMTPAGEHDTRERLDTIAQAPAADELRAKTVRWIRDNESRLATLQPAEPPLSPRARQIWRPLLLLAEAAGGAWPGRARAAAIFLTQSNASRSESVDLLSDIRTAFASQHLNRLTSESMIKLLAANTERPWGEKKLTPRRLAEHLARFNIRPKNLRLSDGSFPRGYLARDFTDAFTRYLQPEAPREAEA